MFSLVFMVLWQRILSHQGSATSSSSHGHFLFRRESMANFFDTITFEVRKEIFLDSKKFGYRSYFSNPEIVGVSLKWV